MAKLTANQQAYALITHFEKAYFEKNGEKPQLNRHRDKWGFQDMVEDLGYQGALSIIDYYFELQGPHTIQRLLRNYDQMDKIRREKADDDEKRAEIRKQTAERLKAWKEQNGDS